MIVIKILIVVVVGAISMQMNANLVKNIMI